MRVSWLVTLAVHNVLPASKPKSCGVRVQSPSLTMIWAVTVTGTLLPLATFTFDTLGFCQTYSRAEMALFLTYGAFGVSCIIAGPSLV